MNTLLTIAGNTSEPSRISSEGNYSGHDDYDDDDQKYEYNHHAESLHHPSPSRPPISAGPWGRYFAMSPSPPSSPPPSSTGSPRSRWVSRSRCARSARSSRRSLGDRRLPPGGGASDGGQNNKFKWGSGKMKLCTCILRRWGGGLFGWVPSASTQMRG